MFYSIKKSNPTVPERAFVAFNGWLTTRRLGESDGNFISYFVGCLRNGLTVVARGNILFFASLGLLK